MARTAPPPAADGGTRRLWLAAVIVAATVLAAAWALLVPIFEAPDEPQHFDYALSIASAGHLLNARDRPTVRSHWTVVVHPETRYLMEATDWERVYLDRTQRMPAAYGTVAYFQQLDRGAPPGTLAGQPAQNPGLLALYPFGYYAVLAAWLWLVAHLTSSLTVLFFAARLLSVLLLPVSLAFSYGITRELGVSPRLSILLTALLGLFPLTGFVASAIQPDNLALALVSSGAYLGLRARRQGQPAVMLGGLGLILGALLVTKFQFYACLAVPLLAALLVERHFRGARTPLSMSVPLLVVPSVALLAVHFWVVWGTTTPVYTSWPGVPNTAGLHTALAGGPVSLARYVATALVAAAQTYYFGGQSFRTFWGTVGWLENPVQFGVPVLAPLSRAIEATWTVLIVGLAIVRLSQVGGRLLQAAGRGRRLLALRLALGDPLLIGYLLFTGFMFAAFVVTDGTFFPQGRNWFPFLLPTWMLALRYAPRALPRRSRFGKDFPGLTAGALLVFCVAGSGLALATVAHRFYGLLPFFSG